MGDRDGDDDVVRPTEPMAPLFEDNLLLDAAAIERRTAGHAPGEAEHVVLVSRDVMPLVSAGAAPVPVDDIATAPTPLRERVQVQTSLGVAPLEPATVVRAPFVIDTPVPGTSRLPRAASPRASSPALGYRPTSEPPRWAGELPPGARPERTAMIALDPTSGMPRPGITRKALASLARRVRSVRWWMARHRRTDVIRRRR